MIVIIQKSNDYLIEWVTDESKISNTLSWNKRFLKQDYYKNEWVHTIIICGTA